MTVGISVHNHPHIWQAGNTSSVHWEAVKTYFVHWHTQKRSGTNNLLIKLVQLAAPRRPWSAATPAPNRCALCATKSCTSQKLAAVGACPVLAIPFRTLTTQAAVRMSPLLLIEYYIHCTPTAHLLSVWDFERPCVLTCM